MASDGELGSDFVSIVVGDGTRMHTQLLAEALRSDRGLQVVAEASNSAELLAAITRVPIDVAVISDLLDDQPGRGTQVLREMRALRPQIKGVILLDSSKPHIVLECFRAGARGIFSKQERLETLSKCIRAVHDGQIWARNVELDHALEALASAPLVRATNHKGIEMLSARERQVIQHLAGGMSNREIGAALGLSPHTVKNYLFRIFDKLGVSSRTELLYLTMNNSLAQPAREGHNGFAFFEAAEAGDPAAQIRAGDYYCKEIPGAPPEPISAYAWYLLAEKSTSAMLLQVESAKENVRRTMSAEQVAEAESKAAAWVRTTKKKPVTEEQRTPDSAKSPKKMRAGAR